MKLRILSVDVALKDERIEEGSFWDADAFSDYDVVIIDPSEISGKWWGVPPSQDGRFQLYAEHDGGKGQMISQFMQRRSDEARMLLEKVGGVLVVFLRSKDRVLERRTPGFAGDRPSEYIDLYSWIPKKIYKEVSEGRIKELYFSGLSYSIDPRSGKEVTGVDFKHPFSQYFQAFQGDIKFEIVVRLEKIEQLATVIARNKAGEIIAFELPFGQGKMIFLPPVVTEDQKKVAGVLLNCISNAISLPMPLARAPWLHKYSLPGENEYEQEISSLEKEIQWRKERKKELEERQNKIRKLKGILDLSGKLQLEPLAREVFSILGFKVLDPEEYEEPYDLYMSEGETYIVGEIEGTEGQVDVQKFNQLLGYVTQRISETGEHCKGVLVANAYTGIDPPKRGKQFTPQVIRGCSSQKYCRITTWELFKALKAVLSAPNDEGLKKKIRKTIVGCDNEFIFDVS